MRTRSSGLTLIELVIVVAIAGILLSVGVPYLTGMVANSTARQASSLLEKDLMYARNTAVTRVQSISVVPVNDEFENGWQILNRADDSVIKERAGLADSVDITSANYDSDNPIIFSAIGGVNIAGTIQVCTDNSDGDVNRQISILTSGQMLFGATECN